MSNDESPRLTDTIINTIVTREDVDKQSVLRRALNLPVRGRVAARIDRALESYGLAPAPTAKAAKGRAEGAAAERARLVAVVRARLDAESPFQPANVRLGLQMALEAMGAAEGSEGR